MSNLLNHFAPEFKLPIVGGGRFSLADWRGHIVVLSWWSADCPWSRRADVALVYRQLGWDPKGVRVLGIASNRNETEKEIRAEAQSRHIKYPVAYDVDQSVATLYEAKTTPHFVVLDELTYVRYIGALDDVTRSGQKPTTIYVDEAVTALLANRPPNPLTTADFGSPIVTRQFPSTEATRGAEAPAGAATAKVSQTALPKTSASDKPASPEPTAAVRAPSDKEPRAGGES
jgi:peroxiredoxin